MTSMTSPRKPATRVRPCLVCGRPSPGDHCAQHDPHPNGRDHHHGYNRKPWKLLRLQALARDGYRCQLKADALCTGTATTVHLDPRLHGNHDEATLEDCKSACAHCHGVVDGPRSTL